MIKRHITNARLSRAVVHNGVVYIAGTTPDNTAASVQEQTREVLRKIDEYLQLTNSNNSNLLSVTVWVKDLANLSQVNEVWDTWLPTGSAPARACVEGTPARSECALEIAVTAATV
jgi:enamine deaminase RidA (YjgF/YER057c/UK114 family)